MLRCGFFRSTTKRLNEIVEKVNEVVAEKIDQEIATINDHILFDDKFLSGSSWEVEELLRVWSFLKLELLFKLIT